MSSSFIPNKSNKGESRKRKTSGSGKGSKTKQRRPQKTTRRKDEARSTSLANSELTLEWPIRLNRYIALAGVASRREADELIKQGAIKVNDEVRTEMGYKVGQSDVVRYQGRDLKPEKPVYILLNKPKDFITTVKDTHERKTVMDLIKAAGDQRVFPVGRLDRNTTGLLLMTNDGDLAKKLTHPSHKVKKVYHVALNKPLTENHLEAVLEGLELEDGKAVVDDLAIISDNKKELGIEIHIGKNRIIRRIFESLGYEVIRLDRVTFAGLTKKDLPRGKWRSLSEKEVIRLKHF